MIGDVPALFARRRRAGHAFRAAAITCVILAATLTGCGRDASAVSGSVKSDEEPGTIIKSGELSSPDTWQPLTSTAKRITYTSRSGIDDSRTHVSGAFFVPKGVPPQGGWPVVVFGHASTGTRPECAPSLAPTLLGAAPAVQSLLSAGYVVAVPDYQGLGDQGPDNRYHPYLDSTTAGYNVIDAVRAVRKLVPQASARWAALGIGQGGQASWAANELADNYGWGLNLVGTASLYPVADINGLADNALRAQLTRNQQLALVGYLSALKNEYGDELNLDDYRRGIVAAKWDTLLACQGPGVADQSRITIAQRDLRPKDPAAADALRGYLKKTSLPLGPAQAPMLVTYGGEDQLIPPEWTTRALQRACAMNDVIQMRAEPAGQQHQNVPANALAWIADRFNNVAAPNDCGAITTTTQPPGPPDGPR